MARSPFSEKIKTILRAGYFPDPDDGIFVSELAEDEVHVAVVTEKVVGKRFRERIDMVWAILFENLTPEEWGRITLTVARTSEEIMSTI